MNPLRATVENGRLIVHGSVDLAEGTQVRLAIVDGPDDLDEADRARLHQALLAGLAEVDAGDTVDASDVLGRLRSR